jgi:hypothetical protein
VSAVSSALKSDLFVFKKTHGALAAGAFWIRFIKNLEVALKLGKLNK